MLTLIEWRLVKNICTENDRHWNGSMQFRKYSPNVRVILDCPWHSLTPDITVRNFFQLYEQDNTERNELRSALWFGRIHHTSVHWQHLRWGDHLHRWSPSLTGAKRLCHSWQTIPDPRRSCRRWSKPRHFTFEAQVCAKEKTKKTKNKTKKNKQAISHLRILVRRVIAKVKSYIWDSQICFCHVL